MNLPSESRFTEETVFLVAAAIGREQGTPDDAAWVWHVEAEAALTALADAGLLLPPVVDDPKPPKLYLVKDPPAPDPDPWSTWNA